MAHSFCTSLSSWEAYSTVLQIAMLGGKVAEGPIPGGGAAARGPSTKPMEVSEVTHVLVEWSVG